MVPITEVEFPRFTATDIVVQGAHAWPPSSLTNIIDLGHLYFLRRIKMSPLAPPRLTPWASPHFIVLPLLYRTLAKISPS